MRSSKIILFAYTLIALDLSTESSLHTSRIYNGKAANISDYSYQISINPSSRIGRHSNCSGAIIASRWAITAAHCITPCMKYICTVQIRSQSNYLTKEGQIHNCMRMFIHENYTPSVPDYDIALLFIEDRFWTSPSKLVRAISIATSPVQPGSVAQIAGWGQAMKCEKSRSFKSGQMTILDRDECKRAYNNSTRNMSDAELCIKRGDPSLSIDDAGAPVVVNNTLVGMVAWGTDCTDAMSYPHVINITHLRSWFRSHIMRRRHPVPPQIFKDQKAKSEDYPYQVSLMVFSLEVTRVCGGAIVHHRWLVTAAQCVFVCEKSYCKVDIQAGSSFLGEGARKYVLADIIIHPQYDNSKYDYDIALVRIVDSLNSSEAFAEIGDSSLEKLEIPILSPVVPAGTVTNVAGWGNTTCGYYSQLTFTELTVLDENKCKLVNEEGGPNITESMMCVERSVHTLTAFDPGTPVAVNGTLVGIIIWDPSCNKSTDTIVLTNVTQFNSWIKALSLAYALQHGNRVYISDFPYHLWIRAQTRPSEPFQVVNSTCSGAIITSYFAVTAAHCIASCREPEFEIRIRAGSSFWDRDGQEHVVHSTFVHEYFDIRSILYNIALIKVKYQFNLYFSIAKPIPLILTPPNGTDVIATGWGNTGCNTNRDSQMKAMNVIISDVEKCRLEYRKWNYYITEQFFCIERKTVGNSIVALGSPVEQNGKLIGIIAFTRPCEQPELPDVAINISYFEIWITLKYLNN